MNRHKLYIGNLPEHITSTQLQAHMGAENAYVIGDGIQRSRGFGFADFGSRAERDQKLQDMNGSTLGGRQIKVSLARRPERKRQ